MKRRGLSLRGWKHLTAYERLSRRLDDVTAPGAQGSHQDQIELLGRSMFGELWGAPPHAGMEGRSELVARAPGKSD
jgi:hypothetical protein